MARACTLCTAPGDVRERVNRTLTVQPTWSDTDVARYAAMIGYPVSRFVVGRHREHYVMREVAGRG